MQMQALRRGLCDPRIDPQQERRRRNLLRRNLLAKTEDFASGAWEAYWQKPAFTTGQIAPDGTATAISWNASTTVGGPSNVQGGFLQRAPASDVGKIVTASAWLKASAPISVTFGVSDGGNSGTIGLTTSWQRFTFTAAITQSLPRFFQVFDFSNENIDIFLWHPQSEYGSVATAYQSVVSDIEFY